MNRFFKSALLSAMFLLVFVAPLAAQDTPPPSKTPRDIVAIWNACYGTAEMYLCGDITTAKMRDNKPKSVLANILRFVETVKPRIFCRN